MDIYLHKYKKYKTKYVTQSGGHRQDIVILHNPNPSISSSTSEEETRELISKLKNLGEVHEYYFKFDNIESEFDLDDLQFENVAESINNTFLKLSKFLIICFEESSPFGLYFVDKYPEKCLSIICFPFRLNTKESLDRYVWKYEEKKGWEKYVSQKYDLHNYLLNINDERLKELLKNKDNKEVPHILYSIMNYNLRKQYEKIPKVFKVPTCLFTRLDISAKGILERNFDRKAIADMKENLTKDDAFFNSMVWNIARVQYDEELEDLNKDNNFLRLQYITADQKKIDLDLLDKVKLMLI